MLLGGLNAAGGSLLVLLASDLDINLLLQYARHLYFSRWRCLHRLLFLLDMEIPRLMRLYYSRWCIFISTASCFIETY